MAGEAGYGETRRDLARTGMAGKARAGRDGCGKDWQAGHGVATRGVMWNGFAWQAWNVVCGQEWRGKAGMTTVYLVRTPGGLKAADDAAVEVLRRVAQGEVVRVELRKVRNPQFHRKFFALLQLVRDSTDAWPTTESLLAALKLEMGHADQYQARDGQVLMVPRSISFGSMDEIEFAEFYERALVTLAEMAGGIESDALRDAVLDEIGRA